MLKKLLLVTLILLPSIVEAQGTGTPNQLRVKTDANFSLVASGAVQTGTLTNCLFSNCRLAVDSSGNLQVVIVGGTISSPIFAPTQTDCTVVSYSFTGRTTTGLNSHAANTWNLCGGGTLGLSGNTTTLTAALPILEADGTAGAPSFSFSSDSTQGMRRFSSSYFGLTDGGSDSGLLIDSSGNVVTGRLGAFFNTFTGTTAGGGPFSLNALSSLGWSAVDATSTQDTSIKRSAAGVIALGNGTTITDFGRLCFGLCTSAFPAIKRVGDDITFVRGDDSANTDITASGIVATGGIYPTGTSRVQLTSPADGQLNMNNSAGTVTATANGTLTTSTTSTCTAANTTETDLWTYTLPAGALSADGRGVRITAWGNFAANANTKNWHLYFGATKVATNGLSANGGGWTLVGSVLRASSTTQTSGGEAKHSTSTTVTFATPAETMANAITIKVTGQNGTAAANDICVKGAIVETIK